MSVTKNIHFKMQSLECIFSNSTWIVPKATLLALRTVDNVSEQVNDQTVWLIDGYNNGYITGTSYTAINGNPTAVARIVGSITPYGQVALAFYSGENVTNGYGTYNEKQQEFTMQMNSLATIDSNVIGLSHWSYMIPVTPKDRLYRRLPGVKISVPDFIKLFDQYK